jgi:hypothetical protein
VKASDERSDIVTQGKGCPLRCSGAHIHTSAHDLGVEFYPCACGKPFEPGEESQPWRLRAGGEVF